MAVRKSIRFEVFKRDGFRCRYCGASPIREPLTIDHVLPRSKGGTDEAENLVTACWSCNSGKSDTLLSESKLGKTMPPEALREQAKQMRALLRAQKAVQKARDEVAEFYGDMRRTIVDGDPPRTLYKQFPSLADRYPCEWIRSSMEAVAHKGLYNSTDEAKYFYGCIRRKREKHEADQCGSR